MEGWKWRVAEPHTATCDHNKYRHQLQILSLSQPGQKGASVDLPAANSLQKGRDEGRQARERRKNPPGREQRSSRRRVPGAPTRPAQPTRVSGIKGPQISLNRLLLALPPHPGPRSRDGRLARVPKRSPALQPRPGVPWPPRPERRLFPISSILHGQPPDTLRRKLPSPKGRGAAKQVTNSELL